MLDCQAEMYKHFRCVQFGNDFLTTIEKFAKKKKPNLANVSIIVYVYIMLEFTRSLLKIFTLSYFIFKPKWYVQSMFNVYSLQQNIERNKANRTCTQPTVRFRRNDECFFCGMIFSHSRSLVDIHQRYETQQSHERSFTERLS